jgi:hypothetical protein
MHKGQEHLAQFLVVGRYPMKVFHLVEEVLHLPM